MLAKHPHSWIDGIIFCCLCFIPTNIFFFDGLDSITLSVLTPLIFLYALYTNREYVNSRDLTLVVVWFLWIVITSFTAVSPSASFKLLRVISGGLMMGGIYYLLAHKEKNIPYLYAAYIVILIAEVYYATNVLAIDTVETTMRANDSKLNANSLAYMTFYSICGIFVIGDMVDDKYKKIFYLLFFAVVPISVFIAFITASRQVLPTSLSVWVVLFVIRYMGRFSVKGTLVFIVAAIISYYAYINVFLPMYSGSLLELRTEGTDQTDTRFLVLEEAMNVALDNILMGIGPGNFASMSRWGIFTHNSYMEILVSSGIIGLMLYVAIIWRFLQNQYRRWKITHDKMFLSLLIIGAFWAAYNVLYVFYVGVFLIPFFFLLMGHSDCIWRKYLLNRKSLIVSQNR